MAFSNSALVIRALVKRSRKSVIIASCGKNQARDVTGKLVIWHVLSDFRFKGRTKTTTTWFGDSSRDQCVVTDFVVVSSEKTLNFHSHCAKYYRVNVVVNHILLDGHTRRIVHSYPRLIYWTGGRQRTDPLLATMGVLSSLASREN